MPYHVLVLEYLISMTPLIYMLFAYGMYTTLIEFKDSFPVDPPHRSPTNIHHVYIDKRINDIRQNTSKWNTQFIYTPHDTFIRDLSSNIFTNIITRTFTRSYLLKHPCSDCGNPSTQRCHGKGAERPLLIKKALEHTWPDTSHPIVLRDIIIAFLEEHKYTDFTFKCRSCHLSETVE